MTIIGDFGNYLTAQDMNRLKVTYGSASLTRHACETNI